MLEQRDNEIEQIKQKYQELIKNIEKEKIILKQEQIDELKRLKRPYDIQIKAQRFEQLYPSSASWTIESLVLKNETFEEWFERAGQYCGGYVSRYYTINDMKHHYNNGGIKTDSIYLKYLLYLQDERILNTEIFERIKNGEKI